MFVLRPLPGTSWGIGLGVPPPGLALVMLFGFGDRRASLSVSGSYLQNDQPVLAPQPSATTCGKEGFTDLPEAYSKTASVRCFSLVMLLFHVLCRKPPTLVEEAHGCPCVGLLSCPHQASARLGHPAEALSSVHLLCLGLAWRAWAASWPRAGPHGVGPAGLGGACVAGWGPSQQSH